MTKSNFKFNVSHILRRDVAIFLTNIPIKIVLNVSKKILNKLILDRPNDICSLLTLGYVESQLNNNDDAWDCFLLVASKKDSITSSQYDLACFNLGFMAEQANNLSEAIFYFNQSIIINNKNGRSWFGLARVCEENGDIEKAFMAYEKVVNVEPGQDGGWYALGSFCHRYQKKERLKEVLLIMRRNFPKAASKLSHELELLDKQVMFNDDKKIIIN